ncbi:NUDIX hydrolase [Candidatus Parcubacteria bacterium]|nr:NUDIX hydrolase [Candidatus Parcubacteria bacterium]
MKGRLVKIEPISKKFHNVFRFTRRTAELSLGNGSLHTFIRHVFETGPAVSILPYFYDKAKKGWQVVLVRQYRPAVDAVCLEAPGGLAHKGKNIKREMARELLEESGITVKPSGIRIVGTQHLATSFCDQLVHLGIVNLKISDSKGIAHLQNGNHGVVNEREFTEVAIVPISRILKNPSLVTYTLAKYQVMDLARRLGIK